MLETGGAARRHGASPRSICVAVLGAGMVGIVSAVRLRERGIECVVFEQADRVGGAGCGNGYPGLSCDAPAHSYTDTLARNPDWSRRHAEGPEIQRYFERIADDSGVRPVVRFGDEVTHLQLVDGIDTFTAAVFHSARWDRDAALDGRCFGVVGTGSAVVQIAAALILHVERRRLFQRIAQWICSSPHPACTDGERAAFRADHFILLTTVISRDGVRLDDAWAVAPAAHVSVTVPCFPNLFLLNGPNGPVGNFSLIEVAERQLDDALQLLDGIVAGDFNEARPTSRALARFEEIAASSLEDFVLQ